MADEVWPFPDKKYTLRNGFSQKARENTIRTSMEAGLDKLRRRYITPIIEIKFKMWLTFSEYQQMETFYNDNLAGGVLTFNFPDPATDIEHECRFMQAPSYSALGGKYYVVDFSFERLD